MAEFTDALNRVLAAEGGMVLTNDPDDRGGQTYAGIARRSWPKWEGWYHIDKGDPVPERLVNDFYRNNFWFPIHGDEIKNQRIATSLFSFAVNAGVSTAVRRAQEAACVAADGVIGKLTIFALNSIDPELFLARFALAKVAKYRDICTKDRSQLKFILGWLNRTLEEAK